MTAAAPAEAFAAVDVVVPVYNAPDDLARCVEAVLAHTDPRHALVLIDDASPDARIAAQFAALEARALPQLTLLRNARNLGFTGTANRGLAHSRRDVVLLNSDAVVTRGWLEALQRCVASDPAIGTATPFSNNAEICSFPRFCADTPWPADADPEPVRAAIAEAAVPAYPDLPTGVGFCLYVRRALVDRIGTLDMAFGAGYGEENDFCMRAHAAGFRNVLCDDAFVLHTGGRSFQGAKETLGVRNLSLLTARHPGYLDLVRDFIARDPLAPLREAARTALDRRAAPAPTVMHVLHGGGGTELHARLLAGTAKGGSRHVVAVVRDDVWRIDEHRSDGSVLACQFERRAGEPAAGYLAMLGAAFGVDVIHLHNVSGSRDGLLDGLPACGIPFGVTIHDLSAACPTITLHRPDGRYCGAQTDVATCTRCLAAQEGYAGVDIGAWRARHAALLAHARFAIAPSRFAADLARRYFPSLDVDVIPHGRPPADPPAPVARSAVVMPHDGVPAVAVLGAIGPDKGARRVERLADLSRARGRPVRFVVIGYLDAIHGPWQSEDRCLTVHSRYAVRDLPDLLDHYGVRLVLFPSEGPETFAYTLSEAWQAGRAVLVPPVGALEERVRGQGAGFVMTRSEWDDDEALLARVLALVGPDGREALDAACAAGRAVVLPTFEAMLARTQAHYAAAAQARPVAHPPVDRERFVGACGYRGWAPPPVPVAPVPPTPVVAPVPPPSPLARWALRLRRTQAGALCARLLPEGARASLRARLRR